MRFKRILSLFCVFALCIGLAACDAAGYPADAKALKTITLAENWDFDFFYPVVTPGNSTDHGFTYWSRNCYDTLVKFNNDGEIVGSLAESFEISEDGRTYTFKLRPGVKFSDGTALTADAVKKSFENAIINLGVFNGSFGRVSSLISRLEAPDDSTFVMTLDMPYYASLIDLTMCSPLAIINPAAFEGGAEAAYETCANVTMGTGPYMYEGGSDGQSYTFVRNPHYWGEAPKLDGFTVKVIEDNDAKVLALRSGEIDAIISSEHLSYDAFSELSAEAGYGTALQKDSALTRYFGLNLSASPFDDVLVRQALSHAIDRETLCSVVLNGIETPAYTLMPSYKLYCDIEGLTTYEFDLAKAKALMDQAGWIDSDGDGIREKDGKTLEYTLSYTSSLGSIDDMILALCDQLSQLGFKLTPSGSNMMTWFDSLTGGNYEITYYYTYGGSYDPATLLGNINPEKSTDPVIMQYAYMIENGLEIMNELDITADIERVREIYELLLGEIAKQALLVPLSYSHQMAVWNSAVIDSYSFNPDSNFLIVSNLSLK